MKVDVWSDVVCPWCFIGLANLDVALEELGEDVDVELHSFQLDPRAVTRSAEEHLGDLARKYGTTVDEVRARQAHLESMGAERGIDFRFDRAVTGNTHDAHRLLHLARERGVQRELKTRLGRAYFTDGEPIGEHDTLRKAAADVGLDPVEVDSVLAGEAYADAVADDVARARDLDVTGVPFFVIDGRYGLAGAHRPEALLRALRRARDEGVQRVDADGEVCGPDGCPI